MAERLDDYKARKRAEYGERFNPSDLDAVDPSIVAAYESGHRVRIETPSGYTVDGYIGVTTGWKPSFLVVHNARSLGGSHLVGPGEKVARIFKARGRR